MMNTQKRPHLAERERTSLTPNHAVAIRTGQLSVCGPVRDENQDRAFTDRRKKLMIVADGMGGHRGGSRASSIVIKTCAQDLKHAIDRNSINEETVEANFQNCVQHAREEIIRWVNVHPNDGQMGTTVAIAVVIDQELFVTHVGDSRIYLFRQGRMKQLTTDETLAQALVEEGAISTESPAFSTYRHVLLNAISARKLDHQPIVTRHALLSGDRLVLCTDGLSEFIPVQQMEEILDRTSCPQKAAERLVQSAANHESTDNITAIVADVVSSVERSGQLELAPAGCQCQVAVA